MGQSSKQYRKNGEINTKRRDLKRISLFFTTFTFVHQLITSNRYIIILKLVSQSCKTMITFGLHGSKCCITSNPLNETIYPASNLIN